MPDRMPADARIAGLVNNAGIAGPGPVECVPSGKLRHLFDVVIVESGAVPAHTWDKAASTLGRAAGATGRYQTLITGVQHRIIERGARHGVPAQTVARVIARPDRPPPRSGVRLAGLLPDRATGTLVLRLLRHPASHPEAGRRCRGWRWWPSRG